MKYVFRSKLAVLLLCAISQAAVCQNSPQQIPDSKNCPTIAVHCTAAVDCPSDEKPVTFTAMVSGNSAEQISYRWEVAGATILDGQGTATISVDIRGLGGQSITAAVDISGLANVCAHKASCSTAVFCEPPIAFLFDRYYPKSSDLSISRKPTKKRKRGSFVPN